MRELGRYSRNSDNDISPVIYGSTPLNRYTWDADMIQGCVADQYGYFHDTKNDILANIPTANGSALNELMCPWGYNRRLEDVSGYGTTSNQSFVVDIQKIFCYASSGYFRLAFRGVRTEKIYPTDTLASLQTKLQTLQTIGKLDVFDNTTLVNTVCDSSFYTNITVHFLTETGSLPLLKVVDNTLDSSAKISVGRRRASRGLVYECAGNGLCDRSTGICHCFPGYGSSDGFGNQGTHGDCGYNLVV